MSTIQAANNLLVEIENNVWSLYNVADEAPVALVRANANGLRYRPSFGVPRRLDANGKLPVDEIASVVVGWAVEDSNWHLGVMVTPDFAQERGGRWCGLVRWLDADGERAKEAGQQLAAALGKPFRLVSRPGDSVPSTQMLGEETRKVFLVAKDQDDDAAPSTAATIEPIAPPPLAPLPITVGDWTIREIEQGILWHRSQGWRSRTMLNGAAYLGLGAVFAALSIGARLSPYATVQPEWLPLVGIGLAAIMLLLLIVQLLALRRAPSVLVDTHQRLVRVMHGFRAESRRRSGRVLVQSPYEGIEYVLVSHAGSRNGKQNGNNPKLLYSRIFPEIWVHLFSPRRGFINVAYVPQTEGRAMRGVDLKPRRVLNLAEMETPLHHAAQHLAEAIGVPAYLEGR